MAPEQVESETNSIDAVTDVYSLGVVLYELLTGAPPYIGPTLRVIWQIVNQDPVPPRLVNSNIPKELEAICLKAISKNRVERYQSAFAFRESLLSWASR